MRKHDKHCYLQYFTQFCFSLYLVYFQRGLVQNLVGKQKRKIRKKKEGEKSNDHFLLLWTTEKTRAMKHLVFFLLSLFIAAKKQVIFGIRKHRKCFVRIFSVCKCSK